MRILLDENFPVDCAKLLSPYTVATVHSLGWIGTKNGELLRRASNICDVFITLDRNLAFQNNIKILPFGIIVVRAHSSRIVDILPHIPCMLEAVSRAMPGQIETVVAKLV